MKRNESGPKGPEQTSIVGGEWGANGNKECDLSWLPDVLYGGPIKTQISFAETFLAEQGEREWSWWQRHWASGDDLHFGDRI